MLAGVGFFDAGDLLGGALGDDLAALVSGFRSEVDDPVGGFDNVEIVFDDDDADAFFDQALEDGQEQADVVEVEAGGWFVEDDEGFFTAFALDHALDEFQSLGFAAAEDVDGLAEEEVFESDFAEEFEGAGDLAFFFFFCKEVDGFGDGHFEDFVDGFSVEFYFENFFAEAFAFALGAAEKEVAEELHFDFFEAEAGAAFAASFAGVEGEKGGGEAFFDGGTFEGKEFADFVEDAEVECGGGARCAGEGGLIDHDDFLDVFSSVEAVDKAGGDGFFARVEVEVAVDNVVDEGAFSGAGDTGDAAKNPKRDVEVEFF